MKCTNEALKAMLLAKAAARGTGLEKATLMPLE
jgi:hypothetical protein